ncbi:glycoside hydrolase family 3 N-terminal domain-containing protein [Caminicella sporogenes]|uniref:glycoside hydrolase family 3 N-terminal domain-containing protein n=1 Tax=Caminicella sporogenes TaxID=166485 RepID=UPI0025404677|nr:glycoside hydrolase family 3 N-terminal domain-containing protein [Caminicella sporogenes]WIF95786.1 glycoside hydrolase family 3 N-terminal domain-containing protein [Caminicella sporogenes]
MSEIYKNPSYTPIERTNDLLSRMTLEEKIGQMCIVDGRKDPETWIYKKHVGSLLHVTGDKVIKLQKMASKTRLGIPILFGIDAVHGHAFQSGATVFPSQLGMSSSWNPELLEKIAHITAIEVTLTGLHWTFSPVLCIGRDLRWGRIDETFGEDPYLIGILASAMIRGYQGKNLSDPYSILACAKHFIAYGETQGGRDSSESDVSERKLRSIFLPPFVEAIKAGCATFMAGYNAIDGIPCSANKWLLTNLLKEELNFNGFVVTDWDNVGNLHRKQKVAPNIKKACEIALSAGNDMIMSTPEFFEEAVKLVKEGIIKEDLIDKACRRILMLKFKLGLFDNKRFPNSKKAISILGCKEHRKIAYKSALESIVLLKNENNILPLSKEIKRIALIGPNCNDIQAQLGDWSFGARELEHPEIPTLDYHPEYDTSPIVTILKGMKKRAGNDIIINYEKGCDIIDKNNHNINKAVKIAKKSDVVIAVVGDTNILNGELRDRVELNLTGAQQQLLTALKETGKPLIVVLINGKPLTIPWIKENADAILEAWNPGLEGGNALASIIFGDFNPCGKLTISFPRHIGQQPVFYNQLPGWHSNRYVEMSAEPLFPFGFGLSYTNYEYSNLQVSSTNLKPTDKLTVSVDVHNTGKYDGTEIVQLYINDIYSSVTTPIKELKGFKRINLKAGEKKRVSITIPVSSLTLINSECKSIVEPGEFEIMIGSSSMDKDLLKIVVEVI